MTARVHIADQAGRRTAISATRTHTAASSGDHRARRGKVPRAAGSLWARERARSTQSKHSNQKGA